MKPQNKAWNTIRLNKVLGLNGSNTITETKIQKYKTEFPEQSKITKAILNNLSLKKNETLEQRYEKIAKQAECNPSEISKFFLHVIDGVLLNKRQIGKQLKNKELLKFVNKMNRVLPKNKQFAIAPVKKAENKFDSEGKRYIWNRIIELLLDAKSPKRGDVITLSNLFQFELLLISIKRLAGLQFRSIEIDKNVYEEQFKKITSNELLAKRVTQAFGDLTVSIKGFGKNSLSHLFADFCGSFQGKLKEFAHEVITNNTVKVGGLIWFTFQMRSCQKGNRELDKVLPVLINDWGKGNYKIELLKKYTGHLNNADDKRTGAKMIAVVIRRMK